MEFPFPRRETRWTAYGRKNRILSIPNKLQAPNSNAQNEGPPKGNEKSEEASHLGILLLFPFGCVFVWIIGAWSLFGSWDL
jgi:hypothetical protein